MRGRFRCRVIENSVHSIKTITLCVCVCIIWSFKSVSSVTSLYNVCVHVELSIFCENDPHGIRDSYFV